MTYKLQNLDNGKEYKERAVKNIIISAFMLTMAFSLLAVALVIPFLDIGILMIVGIELAICIVLYLLLCIRKFLLWMKVNPDLDSALLSVGLKTALKVWTK